MFQELLNFKQNFTLWLNRHHHLVITYMDRAISRDQKVFQEIDLVIFRMYLAKY